MHARKKQPSRTINIKRALLASVVCGSMFGMSGCGIPCRRGAMPGPAMPQQYQWNNGTEYEKPDAEPKASPEPTASDSSQTSNVAPVAHHELKPIESQTAPTSGIESTNSDDGPQLHELLKAPIVFPLQTDPTETTNRTSIATDAETTLVSAVGVIPVQHQVQIINADVTTSPTASWQYSESDLDFGISTLENSAQLPHSVFFNDPYLLELIQQALVGNQELRILAEEIRIACNETYARSGEYRPFVTLGAEAGLEKSGRHTRDGAVEEQLEVAPGKEFPDPLPNFLVGANVSWELDIWKRLRNAQNAAAMRYLATREGRNFVVTRLVAEIADNYYELLALDNRLATLKQTVAIQRQSLEIASAMKEAGRGNQLAVQRFQAEVQKNESEKTLIAQEIVEAENRINFLVGRYPQPVDRSNVEFIELELNALGTGVPSELLQNRPDIRQAEREVAAAGLDVRVARARFYPSLTLTGGLGWNAFSTGYLFRTPESLIYGVAGELVGPLINKRAIQAAYRTANAQQLQSIYNYQQTVLEAHIEVVNYISKVENYRDSLDAKQQQLQSLQDSVDSATKLFQNARVEYVEVLLAQREMLEAKMLLIDTKREQLGAIVNSYQALGGGAF